MIHNCLSRRPPEAGGFGNAPLRGPCVLYVLLSVIFNTALATRVLGVMLFRENVRLPVGRAGLLGGVLLGGMYH